MTSGEVRLIAGRWRGRRIIVPDSNTVRPTPNRVRETVFNWLMPYLPGAICLDAFAGSGALGFEALSRGAAEVVFVDNNKKVITQLYKTAEQLQAKTVEIKQQIFPQGFINKQKFDLVFLDPPFHQDLLIPSILFLQDNHFFKQKALLYVETNTNSMALELSSEWVKLKTKVSGEVDYSLWQFKK